MRLARSIPILVFPLLLGSPGCKEDAAPPPPPPVPLLGRVDYDLPDDLVTKQQTVKSIFDMITTGIPVQAVVDGSSVVFEEGHDEFFERGSDVLAGWEFDGPPSGDDVPVVLYMNLDGSGRKQWKVHRVYEVTDNADGQCVIRRKPSGQVEPLR